MKFQKLSATLLLLATLFASLILYAPPASSQGNNYVLIEPEEPSTQGVFPYAATVGQIVMINITIYNATNIYGYNFTIYWSNLNIVEYQDCYFNPFLKEPYTYSIKIFGGKFTVYAKSQAPANPVSGSGVLVTLFFNTTKTGSSLIDFDQANCWLIGQDGSQFHPSTFKRGKLVVTDTIISVEPQDLSGSVNETVVANVTVYKVTNLYGVEFNLSWNPDVLSLLQVNYQVPWSSKFEIKNQTSLGSYLLAVAALYPSSPYSGDWVFANLKFNVTKAGLSMIKFAYSKLGDSSSSPIIHAEKNAVFSNIKVVVGFDPSVIADVSLVQGTNFTVNVTILEVVNLKSFQIKISYPIDVVNFSSVSFDEFYLSEHDFACDPVTGTLTLSGAFILEFTGNISIATLEFEVVGKGANKITVMGSQSFLKNGEGADLLFKSSVCTFMNWRNVAIKNFEFASNIMLGQKFVVGETINISVNVANFGADVENVRLIVVYEGNITINETSTLVSGTLYDENFTLEKFGSGDSTRTVTISWDTTSLNEGIYYVTANASASLDDYPSDNVMVKSLELVASPVDVAVVNVLIVPPIVYVNDTVNVAVIVKNLGLTTQNFDLFVYVDGNLVKKIENITLAADTGDIYFLPFTFRDVKSYLLNFTIPALADEKILENNVYTKTLNVTESSYGLPYEVTFALAAVLIVVAAAALLYLKRRKIHA